VPLGAPVQPGEAFSTVYETVARRALRAAPGTLIVAAAWTSPAAGPAVFSSVPYPFPASVQLQGPGRP